VSHAPGERILLTIGYEGRTLEAYLAALTAAGCTLLCDVRRNPFSRKPGFSKRRLAEACAGAGIRYEHVPELGVASADRKAIDTPEALAALFHRYRRETLPREAAHVARIVGWMEAGEVVALTCFEREPLECHRHLVAEAIQSRTSATVQDLR
jgi:uncharacterized protein (DUF488 family)